MGQDLAFAEKPLRRNLQSSVADGAAFGLMTGVGETYVAAFALALGMGELASGLIATVPLVVGGALQLATPYGVRWLGSNRRWVLGCALLQALSFLPLCWAAVVGYAPGWSLFLVASIYWGCGLATGPAWNSWIATLVPQRVRASHFAFRSRLNQASVLVGFLLGGALLQWGRQGDWLMSAFAVLFGVAMGSRLLSVYFLSRQSEPMPPLHEDSHFSPVSTLNRLISSSDGRLLLYLLAVQVGVQIAGPYFTPFMLKKLSLSYLDYVVLIGCSFLTKVITLPILGRWAHKAGSYRLLWWGGFGIVPMSGLWLVSTNYIYLILVQIFAGAAWAAYELATFLMFFEAIPAKERTRVLTLFNLGNGLAMLIGSVAGGCLLHLMGETHGAYMLLFGVSSVVRMLSLVLLIRVHAPSVVPQPLVMRTLSLRPNAGGQDRPVLSLIDDEPDADGTASPTTLSLNGQPHNSAPNVYQTGAGS